MRLKLILPTADVDVTPPPTGSPRPGCGEWHAQLHQQVARPPRDTQQDHATVWRYLCVCCGHTFRVYPLASVVPIPRRG